MRILTLLLLFTFSGHCQKNASTLLFDQSDILSLSLTTDFDCLLNHIDSSDSLLMGQLSIFAENGSTSDIPVFVAARGHFRRNPKNCHFPPLCIYFPQKNTGTAFYNLSKLKLVTGCKKNKHAEKFVIKELLCYKMLNLITDTSFRVRPAYITYIDQNNHTLATQFSFFIERTKDLRNRLEAEKVDSENFTLDWLSDYQATKLSMFQLMIGNTDWCCYKAHNIKPMRINKQYYAIPYDFDWSGFVSTSYAKPHPSYPIEHVKQRYYIGKHPNDSTLHRVIREYLHHEDAMYQIIQNSPILSKREQKKSMKYIRNFFHILRNKKLLKCYLKE